MLRVYLLVNGSGKLFEVSDFIINSVSRFCIHIVTKHKASDVFISYTARHGKMGQNLVYVLFEMALARIFHQMEESRPVTEKPDYVY